MKNKITNNLPKIILIFLFLPLLAYFVKDYIKNEIKQYELYNDFTRANIVMTLSFNKDHVLQFDAIRYVQLFNDDKKLSKGDLIYDFSNYSILPILDYQKKVSENEELILSFSDFLDFLADYNMATINDRENILVRQENGKYYNYDKKTEIYTYYIKKNIIDKNTFNKIYVEYLKTKKYNDIQSYFINEIYCNDIIKNKYTYRELKNIIINKYDEFYKKNEDIIVNIIAQDIKSFSEYLYNNYIFIDENNGGNIYLKQEISTSNLELSFKFKKGDRIYNSASKYYTNIYELDINDVWNQLSEKGYPKLYS